MPGPERSCRLALTLALALPPAGGCGPERGSAEAVTAGAEATSAELGPLASPLTPGLVRASEGVTAVLGRCADSPDDDCDGVDDDCDGAIDEGCGLATGVVQVTAAWETDADIDLYVTEPLGDTLSFQRGRSLVGGRVDRVGRGACAAGDEPSRIESLVWEGDAVRRGTYTIALHYWGECQSLAGPTKVTVSVSVAGRVVQSMRYVLSPNELKEIATFDVD